MKIKTEDGRQFDTSPETSIEIERTNPFFSEWGEQSLPITLPASKINQEIMSYPHILAGRNRNKKLTVNIQDGVFNMEAQMLLLSASEKDGYECSLLLNEGSLNSKLQDVDMADIMNDEELIFENVDECLDFLRGLWIGKDERFSIFFIQTLPDENGKSIYLNRHTTNKLIDGYYDFYNRSAMDETQDDKTIHIPAGCYISPFLKVGYLLKRIYQKYGYTFEAGFMSDSPWADMVILNTTADTVVEGKIRFSDLIPNVSVKTFLNVLRKKFCMDFVVDDVRKTVKAILFSEMLNSLDCKDITDQIAGEIKIDFPESYKQLKLHTDYVQHVLTSSDYYYKDVKIDSAQSDYVSLKNLYPDALFDQNSGTIYRLGFKGDSSVIDGIGSMNTDYYTGGPLEVEQLDCNETMPGMMCSKAVNGVTFWDAIPVVEELRFLHTKIIMDDETVEDGSEKVETSNTDELPVMLCFTGRTNEGRDFGTTTNYRYDKRLWNYTLHWNGKDGLFEKFWRQYDNILRNSKHTITTELLLSESDKMQLKATGKIIVNGQELLADTIRYKIGERVLSSCDFVTIALHKPVSEAPIQDWPKISKYSWQVRSKMVPDAYYKTYIVEPEVRYYNAPTEEQYTAGGKYYEVTYAVKCANSKDESGNLKNPQDATLTVWLEPQLTTFPMI